MTDFCCGFGLVSFHAHDLGMRYTFLTTKPQTLTTQHSPTSHSRPILRQTIVSRPHTAAAPVKHAVPANNPVDFEVYLFQLGCVRFRMEAKYFRFLKIVGVGFKARAESEGRLLLLKLGYSHEVELTVPPAVRVFCFKPNVICCTGIDKQRTHQFAATVRSCKPPEVYKGKGIMYIDEVIKKKQGKKSK
ncbi:hypothetical protein Droror1_Dr00005525 [Drosera rotundifolia]